MIFIHNELEEHIGKIYSVGQQTQELNQWTFNERVKNKSLLKNKYVMKCIYAQNRSKCSWLPLTTVQINKLFLVEI